VKYFVLFIPAVLLFACTSNNQPVKLSATLFDSSYKPAVFTDKDRMEKIKQAFAAADKLYKDYADSNHLPGLAFGIVVDGKLVYSGNMGYTDIEKKIPVTSSSLFRIASMSKSFTAMAILKLKDEGKLNLDDPAYKYIPELKNLHYPTADAPHITIRHLLSHSAGFPEDCLNRDAAISTPAPQPPAFPERYPRLPPARSPSTRSPARAVDRPAR
jgi:CubicO group peptidase (beta-lactamase class C family)